MFKSIVFVFPIIHLLTFNIVVLILGPIVLVSLFIWKRIISARQHESEGLPRSRAPHFRYFSLNPPSPSFRRRNHNGAPPIPQGRIDRLIAIWVHGKFWAALVVTLGLEALLIFLFIVINPFVSSEIPLVCLVLTNVFFFCYEGGIFIPIHCLALLPVPCLSLTQFCAQLSNVTAILLTKIYLPDACSR